MPHEHDQAHPVGPIEKVDPHDQPTTEWPRSGPREVGAASGPILDSALGPPSISGYTLERVIAAGGMGTVYSALQHSTGKRVAVKVMHGGLLTAEAAVRFKNEYRAQARLDGHPGIPTILDAGFYQDDLGARPFYVMEHIPGEETLSRHVVKRALSSRQRLELFAKVCDVVHYAHENGYIHLDLKPDNILVDEFNQPRIIDFGVARSVGLEDASSRLAGAMGTPEYMSPEQTEQHNPTLNRRSDVYSLGVILYQLVCGSMPYKIDRAHPDQVARTIRFADPAPPCIEHEPVSIPLRTIMLRAQAKDPNRRYETARDLAAAVRRYLRLTGPVCGAPRVACAAALLAATVVGGWIGDRIGVPLAFRYTDLNANFVRTMMNAGTSDSLAALDRISVIAFDERTDFDAIAAKVGLDPLPPGDKRARRAVHGELMKRLCDAEPAVFVWDLYFPRESDADAVFAEGASMLRERGVPVIVATPNWCRDEQGIPQTSATILPHVYWGGVTVQLRGNNQFDVDLVMVPENGVPKPSIVPLTALAMHRPSERAQVTVDLSSGEIFASFVRPHPYIEGESVKTGGSRTIKASYVASQEELLDSQCLFPGDQRFMLSCVVPSDETIAKLRIDYGELFEYTPAELRRKFKDQIIIVGSNEEGVDIHEVAEGRWEHGVYLQTAAVSTLMGNDLPRETSPAADMGLAAAGAFTGALPFAFLRRRQIPDGFSPSAMLRRHGAATMILVGVIVVWCTAIVLLAIHARYIIDPTVQIATCIAGALIMLILAGLLFRNGSLLTRGVQAS